MEQTSATILEAITVTSLSSRIWAEVCSAMISRRRRRSRRGPPPGDISYFLWMSWPSYAVARDSVGHPGDACHPLAEVSLPIPAADERTHLGGAFVRCRCSLAGHGTGALCRIQLIGGMQSPD